jgi:hypothetical protein
MHVNKHEKLSNLALRNNITEILLKVPLNTITLNQTKCWTKYKFNRFWVSDCCCPIPYNLMVTTTWICRSYTVNNKRIINSTKFNSCCFSIKHLAWRCKIRWLGIRIMCPNGAIFQYVTKCWTKYKFNRFWVSDCCLIRSEQFFSHIIGRLSYISMR